MSLSPLRSVARYVALALAEFEVSLAGEDMSRPWVRVSEATPGSTSIVGAKHVERRRTFAIRAYPVAFNPTAEAALTEAKRVEGLLADAFIHGIDSAMYSDYSTRRHPMRVPLFDYEDLNMREAATEGERVGALRVVEPPTIESFPDPAEPSAYIVAATVRCSWTESTHRESPWLLVEKVTATFGGEP